MALFTTVRCIGGYIERPFSGQGDKDHKIFNFDCIVDSGSYDTLAETVLITNASAASVAGLDVYPTGVWPESGDGNVYFVGDTKPVQYQGAVVRFTRRFATVPSTRSRGLGSYNYTFPAFRLWGDGQWTFNNTFKADPPDVIPSIVLRESFSEAAPAKVEYTYTYSTDIASVAEDKLFRPVWKSDANASLNASYYDDFYLREADFLADGITGTGTRFPNGATTGNGPTSPNITTYLSSYVDTVYLKAASSIKSYMGNIYVRETISVLAK